MLQPGENASAGGKCFSLIRAASGFSTSFIVHWSYDASNDGQRFLVPVLPAGASPPPLTVVLNWQAQLKK